MRRLGPRIVSGHEGRANVWISHRNAVVKAAGETTFDSRRWKNNSRGMLSTIPSVTPMNTIL